MPMTGKELRALREKAGATQVDLAEGLMLGRDAGRVAVSRWENGHVAIREQNARLARKFLSDFAKAARGN